MNKNDDLQDTLEQQDGNVERPADTDGFRQDADDVSGSEDVDQDEPEQEGTVETADTTRSEESAPRQPDGDVSAAGDDSGGEEAPSQTEDGPSEPSAENGATDVNGGGDASQEQAAPDESGESQQRRVVLQAGTDEESLKALALCREKVTQLHLRMHPLAARWENDRHVIIFFRADEKVDFRKLVRELSRLLHARIELRQVGPREQGKLCGLVGKCGYPLCCQTFLSQFAQSTIKMAKTQELALNPMKISGVCGRLLCCLNYEQEMYLEARANMPRVNKMVDTEFGPGRVVAINVLKQTVTVQLETVTKELRLDQVQPAQPQQSQQSQQPQPPQG